MTQQELSHITKIRRAYHNHRNGLNSELEIRLAVESAMLHVGPARTFQLLHNLTPDQELAIRKTFQVQVPSPETLLILSDLVRERSAEG